MCPFHLQQLQQHQQQQQQIQQSGQPQLAIVSIQQAVMPTSTSVVSQTVNIAIDSFQYIRSSLYVLSILTELFFEIESAKCHTDPKHWPNCANSTSSSGHLASGVCLSSAWRWNGVHHNGGTTFECEHGLVAITAHRNGAGNTRDSVQPTLRHTNAGCRLGEWTYSERNVNANPGRSTAFVDGR